MWSRTYPSMDCGRRIVRPAALLEFLAAATGTGIITTYLRSATNDLHNLPLLAEMKVVVDQSSRLAAAPVLPVGVNSYQRRFNLVHPLFGISPFPGDLDAIVGAQAQEGCKPGGLTDGQQTPCLLVELEAEKETLAPFGGTPLICKPEQWLEGCRIIHEGMN